MRRFLTVLAVTALVAAPSLSVAKNPFDFSDWVRKSRTETSTADGAEPASQSPADAPSELQSAPPRNYADELFGGQQPSSPPSQSADSSSRPNPWGPPQLREPQLRERLPQLKPTPMGRPRLEDPRLPDPRFPDPRLGDSQQDDPRPMPRVKPRITSDDLQSHGSEETLQRFDEFLKSRDVVNAHYDESKQTTESPVIHPTGASSDDQNPWGTDATMPQVNGRGSNPSAEERPVVTPSGAAEAKSADQVDFDERFSFLEKEDLRQTKSGNRLTEAIPSAPGIHPSASSSPQRKSSEPNPFAFDEPAQQSEPRPPDHSGTNPRIIPAEAPSHVDLDSEEPHSKSRFSITRTSRSVPAAVPAETSSEAQQTLELSPSTDQRNADISAVWSPTGPLNVGQECPCELRITNLRRSRAQGVRLDAKLPATLQIVEAVPAPVEVDGLLRWNLDALEAGEERSIQLVLVASQPGALAIESYVHFTEAKLQSLNVTEPQLALEVDGPTDVTVGEPATQMVTVHNPGSGVATNVKLEAQVPEGLEHVRGKRLLMNIGSLNPGETRRVRLALAAIGGGQQILQLEARADAGLVKTAAAEVTVIAPELAAEITGPGLRYLGREATYTIRVANVGEAETDAVQVLHHVPEGFDFIRTDRGAQFNDSSRMLTWFVGRLGTEQPQELKVTLMAEKVGDFVHSVRATSAHGSHSDAQLDTRVEGTASLVLEIDDLDDPVEVNRETAYEVTITNEGTASSQDVSLACEMPAGLSFIKAAGPSEHSSGAGGVVFQPIAEVKAGDTLTYRIFVKGTVNGDKRFRCRLTSANLSQPLFTEESTKFYGE